MDGDGETVVVYSVIEPKYEFSAPKYFDFSYEETQEDIELAESWFKSAIPYEASRTALLSSVLCRCIRPATMNSSSTDFDPAMIISAETVMRSTEEHMARLSVTCSSMRTASYSCCLTCEGLRRRVSIHVTPNFFDMPLQLMSRRPDQLLSFLLQQTTLERRVTRKPSRFPLYYLHLLTTQ